MFVGSLIGWIVAGLIVGAFARLIVPGRQNIGIGMTIVLGIVGAMLTLIPRPSWRSIGYVDQGLFAVDLK